MLLRNSPVKADVVVTNPTHYAVALLYEPETMNAAQVIAKGQDLIAFKIIAIAQENNVPVIENRLLARTLYYEVEIGLFLVWDEDPTVSGYLIYNCQENEIYDLFGNWSLCNWSKWRCDLL